MPPPAEDKDEYLADNIFWVPKEARWSHLQANAKQSSIGLAVDDAMRAIEKDNESLKGVLPKDYARPALNKVMLGELIDLISGIALNQKNDQSRDVLGRVYEYFLGQFAGAEGKRGGEFYTPRSVVRTLVESWSRTTAASMTPAAAAAACSCRAKSSWPNTADVSATSPSTDRKATTRRGDWPR
jgi:type I restriction enzyme M protein